ncbi:substrate-binding domain-containing protein [Streptomyces sp. PT12]|uniref:substrate-binding domain-containing protein n=1 Tax=Streptomyces sp. PT12 TaxID=1510197 RepID=UPI001C676427|nr:substrate-binding domain-containing protein [Streptomyces sp. PT12]
MRASIAISGFLAIAACSVSTTPGGDDNDGGGSDGDGSVTIGFSQATQQSPFYVQLSRGAEEAADAAGAELFVSDAGGDVTKQNNDIQDLITRGVDVLLVNPVDPQGVRPGLAAAEAAGVEVVTVDRPVPEGATSYVGRDNEEMGRIVGERVAEAMGDDGGKVVEIMGDAGGAVARDRSAGFHEAIDAVGGIEIVEGPYCNYIRSEAVTAMQDLIQTNPDVEVVYAHNDDMALGALQVLRENGRDDVMVAGVDGLMEAVDAIAEGGPYLATALNDPVAMAEKAVETAVAIADGEDVEESIDAGTALVDPDNAADLTADTTFAAAE